MTALRSTLTDVVVTSPAPRAAWTACYTADSTAVVSQSPAWVDAMEATATWRDVSRHYRFSDGREFVLPLVRRRGGVALAPCSSMPDAWGYGGLTGPSIDAPVVDRVIEDLRARPSGWTRVRPNPLHADAWAAGALIGGPGGTLAVPRRAHVLSLDLEPDEIFRTRFTSACRRAVRSAEKAGITVEADTTSRLVPTFHGLLMRSVDRWAESSHEPLALARWRATRRDPEAKFRAWSERLDGGCRILVARRGPTPIAAMIVLQGHNAHMTRSAMDLDLVGNDRPNELLMWHAIRHAAESGCQWFHLGESGSSANLSRYKEKYGAVGMDYAEHRIERVPATRIDTSARNAVKRMIGFREA